MALRNAITDGKVRGPRLRVSLEALESTAGHGDARYGMDPQLFHPGWDNSTVDSADQARARVREHKRRGADLIKIIPSGGIASSGDDPRQKLMTDDEIAAVITTAHSLGMKVAAHAYPPSAIDAAVRAGVDSIEHGSFATSVSFALMKAVFGRRPLIRLVKNPPATPRSARALIRVIASTRPRFASSVSRPCRYRGWLGPLRTASGRLAPLKRQTGIP